MLGDPTSIYFQSELRFLPIDGLRFGKGFVRELYTILARPGGYAYEDLTIQEGPWTMSSKRLTKDGTGSSMCRVRPDSIMIEETEPQVTVEQFIEIVQTILKAVGQTKHDCAPIFAQKCVIRSIAKPLGSKHSVNLLAAKIANVKKAIAPFNRPPQFFGIRFRFPPYEIVQEETEGEGEVEGKNDFTTVRFETWAKDVEQVWIETAMMTFFQGIEIADSKISDNIQGSYNFLTKECVDFLNQFDDKPNPPDGDVSDAEEP